MYNLVSNTTYISQSDYIASACDICAIWSRTGGGSAPQANACSILRFWWKRKTRWSRRFFALPLYRIKALPLGRFTTVKRWSASPRGVWPHSTDPSHFHHPKLTQNPTLPDLQQNPQWIPQQNSLKQTIKIPCFLRSFCKFYPKIRAIYCGFYQQIPCKQYKKFYFYWQNVD